MTKEKECENAYSNPNCPYISVINQSVDNIKQNTSDIKVIKDALVGEDLRGGIVKDVAELKSWMGTIKPVILSVLSAVITYICSRIVTGG